MASLKGGISRCGLCRFYAHEGRRGGLCSQLNAPVQSKWTACSLGVSPFEKVESWGSAHSPATIGSMEMKAVKSGNAGMHPCEEIAALGQPGILPKVGLSFV